MSRRERRIALWALFVGLAIGYWACAFHAVIQRSLQESRLRDEEQYRGTYSLQNFPEKTNV